MTELPPSLAPLMFYSQFIVYASRPDPAKPGKILKLPASHVTGATVNAHDTAHHTDYRTAIAAAQRLGPAYGVGFVFTAADPFWFCDLDNAWDDAGNKWHDWAVNICNWFAGCAVEVSISGKGLHIIGMGTPPEHGCESELHVGGFYHMDRFVALTGTHATGNAAVDPGPAAFKAMIDYYWPPKAAPLHALSYDGPRPEWNGPTDDEELIRKFLAARGSAAAAFGDSCTSRELWEAVSGPLGKAFPDPLRAYDASKADAALAQRLAWWTGCDHERIDRLMRRSALARDKWDTRTTYLHDTIALACGRQVEVMGDDRPKVAIDVNAPAVVDPTTGALVISSTKILTYADQQLYFKGCTYIVSQNRVLTSKGELLKKEQFRSAYGRHRFVINTDGKLSADAWDVFTNGQVGEFKCADRDRYVPNLPFGALFDVNGVTYVNTYRDPKAARRQGDASPFINHIKRMLPKGRDAEILLYYLAACVQHKGTKFQWAPMIQGVEGNGKSLITMVMEHALGEDHCHRPLANEIGEKFNPWLVGKLYISVEDMFTSSAADKRDVFEILKPMITSEKMSIRAMQTDQYMSHIVCNFVFNTNHKDGLRKSRNDRRIAPLYCAQQEEEHLARDGMTPQYFDPLYAWVRAEGKEIIAEWLSTVEIPLEMNPATGCHRAPMTSSTDEAIEAGEDRMTQEIREAIAQCLPGLTGDWVSLVMAERHLVDSGAIRYVKRAELKKVLQNMGFVQHPNLPDGRTNNKVFPDQTKPVLFVRKSNSALMSIQTAAAVARAYQDANNFPVGMPFSVGNDK